MNESAGNLKRETPGFYKTLMPCAKNTTPHYDFNKKCLPDYLQKFLESNIFWEENFSGPVGDVKTLCLFHLSPLLICRTNNGHTGNLEIFIDFPSNPTNKGEFLIWDTENNYPINVPLQITKTSRKKTKALTSEVSFNIQKVQDICSTDTIVGQRLRGDIGSNEIQEWLVNLVQCWFHINIKQVIGWEDEN